MIHAISMPLDTAGQIAACQRRPPLLRLVMLSRLSTTHMNQEAVLFVGRAVLAGRLLPFPGLRWGSV